jgi:lipoyl(octanoyl) transferase
MKICMVHTPGELPYQQAWELQNHLAAEIAAGSRPPTLLLLEHPHTFTFGRSGQAKNLLWDAAELARRQVEVVWADRGGDVTYHGPGQLVGYPLLPLAPLRMETGPNGSPRLPRADYTGYLRRLEQVIIRALARLGVTGQRVEGLTGVWVPAPEGKPPAKIAAIGVKVDAQGITRHGFALNVAPDMSYWEGIIGCGLDGYPQTSLALLQSPIPAMEEVIQAVIAAFGQVFDFEMQASLELNQWLLRQIKSPDS